MPLINLNVFHIHRHQVKADKRKKNIYYEKRCGVFPHVWTNWKFPGHWIAFKTVEMENTDCTIL